jgi:hypothetical protein
VPACAADAFAEAERIAARDRVAAATAPAAGLEPDQRSERAVDGRHLSPSVCKQKAPDASEAPSPCVADSGHEVNVAKTLGVAQIEPFVLHHSVERLPEVGDSPLLRIVTFSG